MTFQRRDIYLKIEPLNEYSPLAPSPARAGTGAIACSTRVTSLVVSRLTKLSRPLWMG